MLLQIKYSTTEEYPYQEHPVLSDYFLGLNSEFERFRTISQVKAIVSLFPRSPRRKPYDVLPFYSFNTNRTAYAALKQMEEVFADFYLSYDVLPIITPIPAIYLNQSNHIPSTIVTNIRKRGALLYDCQT